jgi:glycerol transport system ATP-binding protein
VVVMHDGAVVQTGTPDELFTMPAHTFVGHFIGSPGMNLLPCSLDGNRARLAGDGPVVTLVAVYAAKAGSSIELGIRPEFTRLSARGDGLPVRVLRIDDLGRVRIARVELAGRQIAATVPEDLSVDGAAASVHFRQDAIHVYADGWRLAPVGA